MPRTNAGSSQTLESHLRDAFRLDLEPRLFIKGKTSMDGFFVPERVNWPQSARGRDRLETTALAGALRTRDGCRAPPPRPPVGGGS